MKTHHTPGPVPTTARDPWAEQAAVLPAALLCDLPVETRFHLQVAGITCDVVLNTTEIPEPRRGSREVVFDRLELQALVIGAEAERLWAEDFLRICLTKLREPEHRLTPREALSGAAPAPRGWSLGTLLDWLGAELSHVVVQEPVSFDVVPEAA